jgi:hypothetical protein
MTMRLTYAGRACFGSAVIELTRADDSRRFLQCEMISPGPGRNNFAQLVTKRFDLSELHVFGGPPANPRYETITRMSHHCDKVALLF